MTLAHMLGGNLPFATGIPFALLFGLVFGSFVSVLSYRVPRGESINGRSKCPHCGVQLRNQDNIPIVGYLLLKGRCRNCQVRISPRYLVFEVATALSVFAPLLLLDHWWQIAAWEFFVVLGVALSSIDLELRRLPDPLTGTLFLSGFILLGIDAIARGRIHNFLIALLCSVALLLLYFVVHLVSRGGMGMGDVKLAPSIGLFLGYESASTVYVGSMLGFALGSLVGLAMMVAGKAGRKSALPFGPFMLIGAVAALWVTTWISHLRGLS